MGAVELTYQLLGSVNAGDVEGAVQLFDEDATVKIPSLTPKRGHDEIRALFDFWAGLNVQWELRESTETEYGATVILDHFDAWGNLLGIVPLNYDSFRISVERDRIVAIDGSWSESTFEALGRALEEFTPWAIENHPELFLDNGDFRYSREAGAGFIAAAEEWMDSR